VGAWAYCSPLPAGVHPTPVTRPSTSRRVSGFRVMHTLKFVSTASAIRACRVRTTICHRRAPKRPGTGLVSAETLSRTMPWRALEPTLRVPRFVLVNESRRTRCRELTQYPSRQAARLATLSPTVTSDRPYPGFVFSLPKRLIRRRRSHVCGSRRRHVHVHVAGWSATNELASSNSVSVLRQPLPVLPCRLADLFGTLGPRINRLIGALAPGSDCCSTNMGRADRM
jgi:hypothetical protein